jgi:ABC-type branched-subunit amino acid transport system permease subunit
LYKALFDMKTTLIGLVLLALLLMLPQFLPRFYVYLLALIFAIALLATSLNLVLGFGGMYQFHHAVFYGFGAYAFALFAHQIRPAPVDGLCHRPVLFRCPGTGAGADHGAFEPALFRHAADFSRFPGVGHHLSLVFLYRG